MKARVRVPLSGLASGERRVEGDAAHYLARVHRLGQGDQFTAFDPGARLEANAEILASERGVLRCRLDEPVTARVIGSAELTLIQCVAKGDKLDEVVRAATALGVGRIVVAESTRAVGRDGGVPRRRERWNAIALDAARQSGRGDLPELEGPSPLAEVLAQHAALRAPKLCLHPQAERALGAALAALHGGGLTLLVGPEGGFASEELALAGTAGFELVSFGPFVLRTELAGIAALGAALAARSDLEGRRR